MTPRLRDLPALLRTAADTTTAHRTAWTTAARKCPTAINQIRDSLPYTAGPPNPDRNGTNTRPDPTAAQALKPQTRAEADIRTLIAACATLANALHHGTDPTRPANTATEIIARWTPKPVNTKPTPDRQPCVSCARVKGPSGRPWHNDATRNTTTHGPLCDWCRAWARDHAGLPPREILARRARGEKIRTNA